MEEMRVYETYKEFEHEFDVTITGQSEGFVKMGYLLKLARDTNILYESGYKTVAEFAEKRYRLRPDTVSKMIGINDRFSIGGNSEKLDPKYAGYGTSLLSEMLTLPEAITEALPEGTDRETIREVKKEIREEQKVSDIEVLIEGTDPGQQAMDSNLKKVLYQYYRERSEEYREAHKAIREGLTAETALKLLTPSGIGTKTVRLQGIGKLMLFIRGADQNLALVNVRTNESETYSWEECVEALRSLFTKVSYRISWETTYGIPFPETEVAPAQMKKPEEPKTPGTPVNTNAPEVKAVKQEASEQQEASGQQELEEEQEPETELTDETEETGQQDEEEAVQQEEESQEPENREKEVEAEIAPAPVNTGVPENLESVQTNIEDIPGALPPGYIKCHDGSEVMGAEEDRKWEEARISAEKILTDLQKHDWRNRKLVESIMEEAEKMMCRLEQILDRE